MDGEVRGYHKRAMCPKCGKSRSMYCADCVEIVDNGLKTPKISSLPFTFHVVRSPGEKRSRSSAIPAKLVAKDHVFLYDYPDIPEEISFENTLLLTPDKTAISIEEVDWPSVKNVIAIDCTWGQTTKILANPVFKAMPKLFISGEQTEFWRYQDFGPQYLATIEAMGIVAKHAVGESIANDLLFYYKLRRQRVLSDCPDLADPSKHPTKLYRQALREKNKQRSAEEKARRRAGKNEKENS